MKNQALQYYMHDGPSAFRFELAGDLTGEGAHRLDRDWHTASAMVGSRALVVDMTFVTGADDEGRRLLADWHANGARIVAKSPASRKLAESIIGVPLREYDLVAKANVGTWLPFHTSLATAFQAILLLVALLLPGQMHAASLHSETLAAWDDYVRATNHTLQERIGPGGNFLWSREDPHRSGRVRSGEIVVAAAPGASPRKINGGLIHHWMGAAFLPNTQLDEVLDVTRDYDHYKNFYGPSVIESQAVSRDGAGDVFSMQLMNRALFLKTALDADYVATNVRLDQHRFYSVSKTTRVQEIVDYGQLGEHMSSEGEGSGYIWKLLSVVRLEEGDGGVYLEMEVVALSREIPGALRPFVDPVVRRVSHNSMVISLQQTSDAVRARSASSAKAVGTSATAGHYHAPVGALSDKASSFTSIH